MTTQTLNTIRLQALNDATRLPALATVLVALAVVVTKWSTRARTRKHLADLPDYVLSDIGVTLSEAQSEISKPFWRS